MASFTLDDIYAAADQKYGATEIEVDKDTTVTLLNALRLPKERRAELIKLQDELGGGEKDAEAQAEVDYNEVLDKILRVVSKDKNVEKLIELVGEDVAVKMEIVSSYGKETQVGEASPSQD